MVNDGYNILIVDDSNVVKAVLLKIVSSSTLPIKQIFDASDGIEALQIIRTNDIGLVITDINMPNMNGVELVENLRAVPETENMPVVVLSTEGSATRIEQLKGLGIRAYLRKPFKAEEIQAILSEMLLTGTDKSPFELFMKAIDQVLPSMTSLAVSYPETDEVPPMQDNAFNVRIEYSGEHSGGLGLMIEKPLASMIAARVLGLEHKDGISEDMVEDALSELMNVICGHFVTLAYGDKPVLKVASPQVFAIKSTLCNMLRSSPNMHTFMLDAFPVIAQVNIGKQP